MTVVHLIKSLNRGGAETLLVEGLRVADRDRFDLRYAYFLESAGTLAPDLRALGADVHCFGVPNTPAMSLAVPRVARYLRAVGADLVHAHLPLAAVVGRLAGRLAGVPIVYTEHNPPNTYHPATRAVSRATWPLQALAVAISPDVATAIRRHTGAKSRVPVEVVLNGVDTDRYARTPGDREAGREAAGIPDGAPVVGVVGMFRPQKRLDVWVEAARLIRETVPDARFLLVGDGELWGSTRAAAEAAGLGDVAHFVGARADVRPYLAAMDVFMMSSAYEGFGLAPVEAMSMEVPVVATAVEGIRSVVRSGTDGVLVPFDAAVARSLATEAVAFLADPGRSRQFGEAGRAAAVGRFGLQRMQREIEAMYVRVVSRHREMPGAL
ncbi:MAG TPA: glycosyltransferase [Rubricoccaceae bacterium]